MTLIPVLPKLSCGLNFFAEIDNLILKFTWKIKGPRIASTTLKRVNFEDSQFPGNTAKAWRETWEMENPEIHWKLYDRLIFNSLERHLVEKEDTFNKWNHYPRGKGKNGSLVPSRNARSSWIFDTNLETTGIEKLLEGNREHRHNFVVSKNLAARTWELSTIEKVIKWTLSKLKTFVHKKTPLRTWVAHCRLNGDIHNPCVWRRTKKEARKEPQQQRQCHKNRQILHNTFHETMCNM